MLCVAVVVRRRLPRLGTLGLCELHHLFGWYVDVQGMMAEHLFSTGNGRYFNGLPQRHGVGVD
jgi:hypothetical protein